ncbi:MAG: hypothetical protein L0Z46_12535 [Nitrospiraceae bacterium]|nr:hypothetical protein [Nitrospiraceae bacterium]
MNDRLKKHQTTGEDVLEWLLKNSTGAITEFEEAQLAEESIYEWLTSDERPPRNDSENQVWEWLTGPRKGPSARFERGFGADEQARIAEALHTLHNLLEDQVAQRPTGGRALRENALRPRYRADTEDASPTPVLHLEKVKISGLPEIILTLGSGGRYEGFFATPIHLREDQTSNVQPGAQEIELTGRIQIEESGTRRNYDSTKDGKEWPLGGVEGSARVKVEPADGPTFSGAAVRKVQPDGTFVLTNRFGVDGFTRSLTIHPVVELKGGKSIAATVVVELIDLDGFLALVEPKEKARPSSQTHLEFLASVRKIYQGGPKDPLSGAFDWVLYRYRNVKPLVPPDTAEDRRFKLYKDWLFADREWVDIGHVLTGIEGSPKQEPSKDQNIPVPGRPELFVTWAGDLGSALQAYIKDFWNAIDKGDPIDLKDYLLKRASRIDLIGDIDGINIGSAYDSSRSLAENLRAYYGQKSRHRYHEFIANSKDKTGKAELPLVSGKKPPQLSKQARQAIAHNTDSFLFPSG